MRYWKKKCSSVLDHNLFQDIYLITFKECTAFFKYINTLYMYRNSRTDKCAKFNTAKVLSKIVTSYSELIVSIM